MQLRYFACALFALFAMAYQATAQTALVDRAPDPSLTESGVICGVYTDRPGEEVLALTAVTFTEQVTIDSITVYTTNLFGNYPIGSSGTAVLDIVVGSNLTILDDVLDGGDLGSASVPVDYISTSDGIAITASGLDITLPATTFLIGLTPILNFSSNNQEFLLDAGSSGQTTFLDNPEGALFQPVYGTAIINANVVDLPTQYTGQAIRIASADDVLLGDVNGDGQVNLLDVAPFVELVSSGGFQAEADINGDGVVNLLDVGPFVALLTGG